MFSSTRCKATEQVPEQYHYYYYLYICNYDFYRRLQVFSLYPNASDPAHILSYLVQDLMPIGLKGFVIAGLLAIIMSTADTELNTGSIALAHDVIKKISTTKIAEPRLASIITSAMGAIAVITAMQFSSVLDAILFTYLLWYPVMICPLILGIYGLKSNDKTFITSTLITAVAVIIFHTTWSHNFALSTICGSYL